MRLSPMTFTPSYNYLQFCRETRLRGRPQSHICSSAPSQPVQLSFFCIPERLGCKCAPATIHISSTFFDVVGASPSGVAPHLWVASVKRLESDPGPLETSLPFRAAAHFQVASNSVRSLTPVYESSTSLQLSVSSALAVFRLHAHRLLA